ncbi:T9SS type A sorting domain-containing protein [Lewinella sp. LCG006]|uniref:T9SS type A sorting domain-containing protein n=1 Tax=Lewinella sp. LCG006 TaxID=3231911 RepID=UPI00345F4BB5
MKNIKLLMLLVASLSLQVSWAQDAVFNNGRDKEAKPNQVAEKADAPAATNVFKGSDLDVPGHVNNSQGENLVFPNDLETLREELHVSSSPRQVVEKLNVLAAQMEVLVTANEELRRENEVIRKSLNRCCESSNLDATDAYLLQNAPNPVVDNSTIRYFVPENMTDARVEISDLKGIVLQTYEIQEMGLSNLRVDTQTLGTGNYVYTLYVEGNIVDSRIMVVTK